MYTKPNKRHPTHLKPKRLSKDIGFASMHHSAIKSADSARMLCDLKFKSSYLHKKWIITNLFSDPAPLVAMYYY